MAGWRITWCHLVCAVVPPGRATRCCRCHGAGCRMQVLEGPCRNKQLGVCAANSLNRCGNINNGVFTEQTAGCWRSGRTVG